MFVQEETYTSHEFWETSQLPENQDRRLELVNGVIVEVPASSPLNSFLAALIRAHISRICQITYQGAVGVGAPGVTSGA